MEPGKHDLKLFLSKVLVTDKLVGVWATTPVSQLPADYTDPIMEPGKEPIR